jgi:hypothetical protein
MHLEVQTGAFLILCEYFLRLLYIGIHLPASITFAVTAFVPHEGFYIGGGVTEKQTYLVGELGLMLEAVHQMTQRLSQRAERISQRTEQVLDILLHQTLLQELRTMNIHQIQILLLVQYGDHHTLGIQLYIPLLNRLQQILDIGGPTADKAAHLQ